jgi:hypothetical protein
MFDGSFDKPDTSTIVYSVKDFVTFQYLRYKNQNTNCGLSVEFRVP